MKIGERDVIKFREMQLLEYLSKRLKQKLEKDNCRL